MIIEMVLLSNTKPDYPFFKLRYRCIDSNKVIQDPTKIQLLGYRKKPMRFLFDHYDSWELSYGLFYLSQQLKVHPLSIQRMQAIGIKPYIYQALLYKISLFAL